MVSRKHLFNLLALGAVSVLSSLALTVIFQFFPPANLETHVPHGLNEVIERNYDGPLYVAIARTGYEPQGLEAISFNGLAPRYYASHFPLFPVLIKIGSLVTNDYFRSMVLVNWLIGAACVAVFYLFLVEKKVSHPLLLSFVFLFVPPRWLAVRTVGASEVVFVFSLLLLTLFWIKKNYFWAAVAGVFLVLTRPPGILFFPAVLVMAFYQKLSWKQVLPLFLIPLALVSLFGFYFWRFGDPLVLFHNSSGTQSLLTFLPFGSFSGYSSPVSEGFIYLYSFYAIGLYLLWRQKETVLVILCSFYFLASLFIKIDDVYRELIPISAFLLIFAYRRIFTFRYFPVFLVFLVLVTYIYTLDLLPHRMFLYDDYARVRLAGQK